MINVVSLAPIANHALPGQTIATSVPKICDRLSLDAEVTGVDGIILSPDDTKGANGNKLNLALQNKHPSVCVIYIYTRTTDADRLNTPNKLQCKKIKDSVLVEAVQKFMGDHLNKTGRSFVSSDDFQALENVTPGASAKLSEDMSGEEDFLEEVDDNFVEVPTPKKPNRLTLDKDEDLTGREEDQELELVSDDTGELPLEAIEEELEALSEIKVPPIDNSQYTEMPSKSLDKINLTPPNDSIDYTMQSIQGLPKTVEDRISNVTNIHDWELYKENLNRQSIEKHLIEENTEYVGLVNYLDVLDEKIKTVWRNPDMSASEKLNAIKSIGQERSVKKAAVNSIHIDKAISIMTSIIQSASHTVDEKIKSIDTSLYKITTDKEALLDTTKIDKAIQKRTDVQLQLLELARSIVDLYKTIDNLVDDELRALDENLPSNNAFINHMVEQTGFQIVTPINSASLALRLTQALQDNRIKASQIEGKVRALIDLMFEMCEASEEVIRYQDEMIHSLKANRVEDVVIVDSLLKECLRVYIGPRNSGTHTTAIVWSGILSRRQNTLLVDLTTRPKFRLFDIEYVGLEEFMDQRIETPFLCVQVGRVLTADELHSFVLELKSRLNYYANINVIIDEDDAEILEQLSQDARTINYVTNCSSNSLDKLTDIYQYKVTSNIAKIAVMIDPPVSPLNIADRLGIDCTSTKIITLPNIPQIRACELSNTRPYEAMDVVALYEEAYR